MNDTRTPCECPSCVADAKAELERQALIKTRNAHKLTMPQRNLLTWVAEQGELGGSIWGSRGVGPRLKALGLIEPVGGTAPYHQVRITDAGRAALAEAKLSGTDSVPASFRSWLMDQAVDAVIRRDETKLGTDTWRWWDGRAEAFKDAARKAKN
jgi:hypothetical protein